MEAPPLGSGGKGITWPDQVAPRGRKASSTCKIKPQTSNLDCVQARLSTVAFMAPGDVCHGSEAAWSGSDQRPWGTAPAAGLVGRLSRPTASDPLGLFH